VRQVELAILGRLRSVPRSYTGLALESYAGQLDDELFGWVRMLPAGWVTFGQISSYQRKSARSFVAHATFEVLSAQRALQENDRRLVPASSGLDVGVYELLEDNKLALINQRLDLPIQPITPGAVRPVMKGLAGRDAVAIYAQEFHTSWMEVIPEPDAVPAGELVSVGLNYFLKPQHSAGVDQPDATDLITLNP
jgi:phage gp37-like protein